MARGATAAVLAGGLLQGVALVTFPAASGVLTARDGYGLSTTAYGLMFVPQVVLAILASLAGGALGRRLGVQRVLLAGLALDLVAMLVLAGSGLAERSAAAYPLLLVATAALGAGFGLAVPALNTIQAALHPSSAATAGLALNALLGLGTALAPVFAAVFTAIGAWWLLPVLVAAALVVLIPLALRAIPREAGSPTGRGAGAAGRRSAPAAGRLTGFAVVAAAALLYGLCETMSGNWSQVLLSGDLGAPAALASAGLAVFWAAVTVGRIALAGIERAVRPAVVLRVAPIVIAVPYAAIALLPRASAGLGIAAFAVAGLGCAAMLPQLETLSQQQHPALAETAASRAVAFYQAGYGVAAFGVGPLRSLGVPLEGAFGVAAVAAVGLAVCTTLATRARTGAAGAARG